jgi:hypothetical protein
MKRVFLPGCLVAVLSLVGAVLWAVPAGAVPGLDPSPTNPPCPQIGFSDGCAVLITINADGTITTTVTGQPAYDGVEDQLVGVINNFGSTIPALTLTGSGIFGFDGDGAGEPGSGCVINSGNPFDCFPGGPFGPTGYEGPGTSFSNIVGFNTGNVNFTGGLPTGGGLWFSLEEGPSAGGFTPTLPTGVPEPGTLLLLGTGLIGIFLNHRRCRA